MSKRTLGFAFLILGIGSIIGASYLLVSGIFKMTKSFSSLATMGAPGESAMQIPEAGVYTLWHDYRTVHDGNSISHPPALPTGFRFSLVRDKDGVAIPLDPARANSTFSTPSRDAVALGTFTPDRPGSYTLKVTCPASDLYVFSLSEGSFLGGMTQFGMRTVLALLAGFLGLVLLILGIVFILMKSKPKPIHPTASQLPPPPPA